MQVKIAGYNIDQSLIAQIPNQNRATPETISAAYARISRSKKDVTTLRQRALEEVEKARQSNENIIFEMGHSSVAEHAVFNFDLIGVSRYLVETIQKTRLASFTEKSQRYVTLDGDYVVPPEIVGSKLEKDFHNVIAMQNNLYDLLYQRGTEHLSKHKFAGSQRELEGRAKEDARYMLALATETQMGMTINARSLAKLLRRLDAVGFAEAQQLKQELEAGVKAIAPSLIRYTQSAAFEQDCGRLIPEFAAAKKATTLKLLRTSKNVDDEIIKAMAFEKYGADAVSLEHWVDELDSKKKQNIFDQLFSEMKFYHTVPRAFEMAEFAFEFSVSSCCFGQLKRHRISTILRSQYHPELGYVVPNLLKELKVSDEIKLVLKSVHELYYKLENQQPGLGNYILTNAHKLNIIFKANLRELYHFVRLRSDQHAQWEIRELSQKLEKLIKEQAPLAAKYLMGKDKFENL
ncbi:MAG: FAD-dependent thymidylate synthase [Candidatus Cloacimonadales bacterium]